MGQNLKSEKCSEAIIFDFFDGSGKLVSRLHTYQSASTVWHQQCAETVANFLLGAAFGVRGGRQKQKAAAEVRGGGPLREVNSETVASNQVYRKKALSRSRCCAKMAFRKVGAKVIAVSRCSVIPWLVAAIPGIAAGGKHVAAPSPKFSWASFLRTNAPGCNQRFRSIYIFWFFIGF